MLCALGLLGLGVFVLFDTGTIPQGQNFSGVGPRLFPYMIGAGLAASGALLTWRALTGGWPNMPDDEAAHATPDRRAFVVISTGILLQMAFIGWAGFIVAGVLLFVLVARGFGSVRPVRDVVVGALLVTAAYLTFTQLLALSLPAGWLPFL